MAISRLRDVVGLLLRKVARASGDRVQHRLIDIRWLAVDQRHGDGSAASPWKFAGDRQASDAAAHDDNVMRTPHYAFLLWFDPQMMEWPVGRSPKENDLGLFLNGASKGDTGKIPPPTIICAFA
jgi:hypothetical protein